MFLQNIVNNRGRVLHVFHPIFRSLVISLSNFRLHVIFGGVVSFYFQHRVNDENLGLFLNFLLFCIILKEFHLTVQYLSVCLCAVERLFDFFPLEVRKLGSPGDDIVNRNKQTAQWLMPSQGTDRHVPLFCCGFLG